MFPINSYENFPDLKGEMSKECSKNYLNFGFYGIFNNEDLKFDMLVIKCK